MFNFQLKFRQDILFDLKSQRLSGNFYMLQRLSLKCDDLRSNGCSKPAYDIEY